MVKLFSTVKRHPGIDHQTFLARWHSEVEPLLATLPGMRRHCANLPVVLPGREPRLDLIDEAWWDTDTELRAALTSPPGQALRAAMAALSDSSHSVTAILSERTVVLPPAEGSFVKNFVTVYHRPDLSLEQFDRHWWNVHPGVVTRLPGLRGYVQCPAVRDGGEEPPLDGCAILWFDSIESLRAAARSPAMPDVSADQRIFLLEERMLSVVAMPR